MDDSGGARVVTRILVVGLVMLVGFLCGSRATGLTGGAVTGIALGAVVGAALIGRRGAPARLGRPGRRVRWDALGDICPRHRALGL